MPAKPLIHTGVVSVSPKREVPVDSTPSLCRILGIEESDLVRAGVPRHKGQWDWWRLHGPAVGSETRRTYNSAMSEANENSTSDDLLIAVGRRIKDIRESKRIQPVDFAKAAGFSLQYLWRLEEGQQNLNLRSLSRISLALDVPMTALLEGIKADPATLQPRPYQKKSVKAAEDKPAPKSRVKSAPKATAKPGQTDQGIV